METLNFCFSDPPSLVDVINQTHAVVEGVNVTLQCKVIAANPEPNITWYSVTTNSTALTHAVNLRFSNISRSSAGKYYCVVDNGIGPKMTSGTTTLDVQCEYLKFIFNCK